MDGRPITITLHVNAAAAVREGRASAGPSRIRIDQADLMKLDPLEREALIRHLEDAEHLSDPMDAPPRWGHPLTRHTDPIGHADFAVLRKLLRQRADVMVAAEAGAVAT